MNCWKSKQANNNYSDAEYVLSFAQYYPYGSNYYMFGGLYKIEKILPEVYDQIGYKLTLQEEFNEYIKRLIIKLITDIEKEISKEVEFNKSKGLTQALAKFELKIDKVVNCGGVGEYDNGNGSLMRLLPIVYYIYYKKIDNEIKIYNIVKEVSSITHAHEISVLGCYIYTRYCLDSINDKWRLSLKKYDYIIDLCKKFEEIL